MPKSHRTLLKRSIANAYLDIEQAIKHIALVGLEFEPVHPELSEPLVAITEGLLISQSLLRTFVKEVWDNDDPNWRSWRNEVPMDIKEANDE